MLIITRAWCRTISFQGRTEGVPEPAPQQWRHRVWAWDKEEGWQAVDLAMGG
jgi:hypothetical protein